MLDKTNNNLTTGKTSKRERAMYCIGIVSRHTECNLDLFTAQLSIYTHKAPSQLPELSRKKPERLLD